MIWYLFCSVTINAVFILFKLFYEILKFSYHWKEMLKEGIYEQTFILYLGARKEDTSARRAWENYVVRMQNILLSGMNFITSSQCTNGYTSYSQITNKWNTKSFFYFISPAILGVFICVSALQNFIQYILVKLSIYVYELDISV